MWARRIPTAQADPAVEVADQQSGGAPERRTMTALRMGDDERIVVDGRLDEPVWDRAVPATDFLQQDPENGAPPTERTEVRIVYTREALYMGVICFDDEPGRLLRYQRRRDEFLQSDDRLMWVIDPFLTAQNGYFFETNPSGLMGDSLLSPAGGNRQWDGIWTLRVQRSDIGWTFEVEIPFSTLNFDPNASSWGINFQRTVRRKNEESLWTGWARNQGLQRLANTGLLQGLNEDVSQGIGLEVRPYGLFASEASPITGQPDTINDANAGIDLSYSLTPGLRAIFTVNTDFAQTEVDQRAVNLTRFPLFFPEKRTFFLEGANFFDFGSVSQASNTFGGFRRSVDNSIVPFFSRRIGLDADGNPQKIDFGVKLIGQLGRQDLGVLHVRTGTENGVPGEDFMVLRVKRRLRQQSYVGGFYTLRNQSGSDSPGSNSAALQTAGADFRFATSSFRDSQNLSVGGFFLQDTNPLGTGKSASYGLQVDYPNDRWNAGASYRTVQENFHPAVAFTRFTLDGYRRYSPYLNFLPRPANHRFVRRFAFTADVNLETDMENRFLTRLWDVTVFSMDLHTQDNFNVHIKPQFERLNRDFQIHPGVTLPSGAEHSFVRYRVGVGTANRRVVAVTPAVEWGNFLGGTRRQINFGVTLRLRPGVIIYGSGEWNRIDLPEGKFQTRLYRLTPELQFSQWLSIVNTIQYDSVSRVLGWQARFRWILKPGNDLYIVYTQNWRDDLDLNRFSTLNRRAATKVLYTHRF